MRRGLSYVLGSALLFAVAVSAFAQPKEFTPREETPEEFPAGPGREETFYTCTACHGFKLVAQQGMSRQRWDDTLNWMTEKQGMPALEGNDRKLVLDYLETAFPPSVPAGRGAPNPFLKQ
jgi:mono/diheme cytochrome c family protein